MSARKDIHAYLTLRCVRTCPYCSTAPPGMVVDPPKEEPGGLWARKLIELNPGRLFITGGEPLLYPGLQKVLSDVRCTTAVYSTLRIPLRQAIGQVEYVKHLTFRATYHRGEDLGAFLEQIHYLKHRGISTSVHVIATDKNPIWALEQRARTFRRQGIEALAEMDQRRYPRLQGPVTCKHPTNIIGPDLRAYHCVSRMVRRVGGQNITLWPEIPEKETVRCETPDLCSPCDMAASYQEEAG